MDFSYLTDAAEGGRRRIRGAGEEMRAVAPVLRRMAGDPRTRAAAQHLMDAGRGVAEEIRRNGGRATVLEAARRGSIDREVEGTADALRSVANGMARSRRRRRRRAVARAAIAGAAMAGAVAVAARFARGGARCGGSAAPGPVADGRAAQAGHETRPSGVTGAT